MIESDTLRSSDVENGGAYVPGRLIGEKYRLLRFLGEGSQGAVWLAENVALSADVAVKIVRADATNPVPTLRLEKEARTAARIGHPGVVRVFDFGRTPNGDAFIVMEYLKGENLGERLTTARRIAPVEAVRTLLPIADVLHVAHETGIVHRDLKPENVFLARNGGTVQPKLLDFGIAKRRPTTNSKNPVITGAGALLGSPAYLSPEQAVCREDVGQAADIWSFCVVLYECLTGALPFESNGYRELFRKIEHEEPRSILAHGVHDVELWAIIRRGLAKTPAERWPDIQALGRALAIWLKARGVQDDISGLRLDSRWLGRAHGERAATQESSYPRSFVRSIGPEEKNPEPALPRRSPSRLFAAGFVAFAATLALAYGLWTPGPEKASAGETAGVQVPVVAPSAQPLLTDSVSTKSPPVAAPLPSQARSTTSVASAPHASQPATPKSRPKASPSTWSAPAPGTPPARAPSARRKAESDLIEPY